MYFGVYDDNTIRKLKLKGSKAILVRVLEPSYKTSKPSYEIENIDEYINVLELYFDDILIPKLQTKSVFFSTEMARRLNQFILQNEFDEIAVHCSLGISRSPAIALCIAKILKSREMEQQIINYKHFRPNKQVLDAFKNYEYSCKEINLNEEIVFRNPQIYKFKDIDMRSCSDKR